MKCVAAIPARLESTRVPKKILLEIQGRTLLWHVWKNAVNAGCFDDVIICTDSQEVASLVGSWGGSVVITQGDFVCGSERIASVATEWDAGFFV